MQLTFRLLGSFEVLGPDGPLTVGDRLTIDDDAILFRATVGNDVTIEEGAIVVGPAAGLKLRDGLKVPAGKVITSQAQVDALG